MRKGEILRCSKTTQEVCVTLIQDIITRVISVLYRTTRICVKQIWNMPRVSQDLSRAHLLAYCEAMHKKLMHLTVSVHKCDHVKGIKFPAHPNEV